MNARTLLFSVMVAFCLASGLAKAQSSAPISLFDGQTLAGWVTYDGEPVTTTWDVQDGALHCGPKGISILSDKTYGDFELTFEWRIAAGGNSGLKYRVKQYGNSWLGLEYQLLDDADFSPQQRPKGSTGSIYDIYEPDMTQQHVNPIGEYNHSRIVVCGTMIQHWLNGRLLVEARTDSPEWVERIGESKFDKHENFGLDPEGRIMLQNHGSEAWFRHITLRPLTSCPGEPTVVTCVCEAPTACPRHPILSRLRSLRTTRACRTPRRFCR